VGIRQARPQVNNGIFDLLTEKEISQGAVIPPPTFQNFYHVIAPLLDRKAPQARQHRELLEQQKKTIARPVP
jgi:hypothetical protein